MSPVLSDGSQNPNTGRGREKDNLAEEKQFPTGRKEI